MPEILLQNPGMCKESFIVWGNVFQNMQNKVNLNVGFRNCIKEQAVFYIENNGFCYKGNFQTIREYFGWTTDLTGVFEHTGDERL